MNKRNELLPFWVLLVSCFLVGLGSYSSLVFVVRFLGETPNAGSFLGPLGSACISYFAWRTSVAVQGFRLFLWIALMVFAGTFVAILLLIWKG